MGTLGVVALLLVGCGDSEPVSTAQTGTSPVPSATRTLTSTETLAGTERQITEVVISSGTASIQVEGAQGFRVSLPAAGGTWTLTPPAAENAFAFDLEGGRTIPSGDPSDRHGSGTQTLDFVARQLAVVALTFTRGSETITITADMR